MQKRASYFVHEETVIENEEKACFFISTKNII